MCPEGRLDPLWTPKKACKGADTALLTSLPTFPNKSDLKCLGLDFYFFRILLVLLCHKCLAHQIIRLMT